MPKSIKRSKRQSSKKVKSSTKPRKVRKSSKRKSSSRKRSSKKRSKRVKKGGNIGWNLSRNHFVGGLPVRKRYNTCAYKNRNNFKLGGGGGCGKKH